MSSITYLQELREAAFVQAQQQELLLSEHPSNIFYQRTLQRAQEQTASLTAEIIQRQRQREQEIVEVRLIGATATRGTLPLDTLATVSSGLSDTLHQVARHAAVGAVATPQRGLLPKIKRRLDLRLAGVASGSTRLFISGQTNPDLFGNSLLSSTLDRTFNLLATEEPEAVLEQVPAMGQPGIQALQKLLRSIHDCHLEVELTWDTPAHELRSWMGSTRRLVSLSSMLGHMAELAPESFDFSGQIISLSLKGFIEVQDEQRGRIVVRYPEALLAVIQTLHVGQDCKGTMVQLTVEHTTTGARKLSFTLMGIEGEA